MHLKDKEFDCIRVDEAHDENPAGLEIQFLWTERHVTNNKTCTIVTTRHSGGSYLNRVELQNGCLALAHSHLFIPSTLNGHNFNEKGLDSVKLRDNLNAATEVYINRVDGAPCHFLPPQQCFKHIKEHGMQDCAVPPSIVLNKAFEDAKQKDLELETMIPELAKTTNLTTEEVKMWFGNLQLVKDRCKEGAKKAKDTRAKNKGI